MTYFMSVYHNTNIPGYDDIQGDPKKTDTQFYFWDNRDIGLIGFQFTFWILKKVFSRLREMD